MRNNFLITGLVGMLFSFFLPFNAGAATEVCVWRMGSTSSGYSTAGKYTSGCLEGEYTNPDTNCNADTQPNPKTHIGYRETPECCCQTSQAPPKPPKFIMPELQINIPTLKLTASSSINYITNDDGSTNVAIPWISEYIIAIYNYGLSVAGILAAIILMAGGVLWLISGGDASKVTQAKELIIGSVVGLVILASSYVLLIQVNPNLVKFKPISIGTIKYKDSEPVSTEGNINNSTTCDNCVTLTIPFKDGDQVDVDLAAKLITARNNSDGLAWIVTEAYPPTVAHASACHYNGMCVDVALTTDKSCAAVDELTAILGNASLSVLNEYTGCGGTQTTYSTGGHLHVH